MARPHPSVLWAIAAAEAREGNLHYARLALRKVDPLRRGALFGQVRRALDEAEERCGPGVFGPQAPRHYARVAYLLAADVEIAQDALADVSGIQARYDAERSKHPAEISRGFPLTLVLAALVLAGGLAAGAWWLLGRPITPSLEGARRTPPAPAGAFARGGRPAKQNATLREIFGEALPNVFVAAARLADARAGEEGDRALRVLTKRLETARKATLTPEHLRALGEHAAKRLADLLAAIQNAALAETRSQDDATAKAFHQAVDLLNRELAAGDFGYHLVGDLLGQGKRRLVLLASYGVEEVVRYRVDQTPVTVLRLDRLDETNWSPNRLGAQREGHLAPFVEMSTVRRELLTFVIPELITDGGLTYDGKRLSNAVTQKEHRALLGERVADLVALGTQLGKRIRILRRIQRHPQTKISFLLPDTMARDRELTRLFKRDFNAPIALVNELETVLGAIDVPAYRGLVDRIAPLHAALTESFVLQLWHDDRRIRIAVPSRIPPRGATDAPTTMRLPPAELPPAIRQHLAPLLGSGAHNERVAEAAERQLSGQLASLAHAGILTRTQLTRLSGNLFDTSAWHTPRSYATLVVWKELGRILGVSKAAGLSAEGDPDRELASHVYADLVGRDPAAVRQAARGAWDHLYTAKMPVITRLEAK